MKRPPTDLELLQAIFERHRDEYANFGPESRAHKNAVPIDIPAIATELGVDENSVFGRLYHHLDPRYSTVSLDGKTKKGLFIPQPGPTKDLIVFPVWRPRSRASGKSVTGIYGLARSPYSRS